MTPSSQSVINRIEYDSSHSIFPTIFFFNYDYAVMTSGHYPPWYVRDPGLNEYLVILTESINLAQ